jgi:hypothetical protein
MKKLLKTLALSLAVALTVGEVAMAQVQFRVPLYLQWGTKRDTVYVGVNGGNGGTIQPGTYGLDLVTTNNFGPLGLYGESGSPPPDADGNRVRFIDVNSRTQIGAAGGFFKYDFRGFTSSTQADTFAVEITGAVVEGADLTVSWPSATTLQSNGTYWAIHARNVGATSAGAQIANMLSATSTVFTAVGGPIRFTVVKVGAIAPSPGPTFSAGAVNFGTVAVGGNASANLVITNTGSANPMSVTAISAAAAPFTYTVPALPATVAPGASLTIPVTFAPTAAGSFNLNVSVTHNAPGSPSVVALSGVGASNANKLFFTADSVVRFDKTNGYRDSLVLNIPSGMKAIQFQIESKGLTLLRSITKGASLLASPYTASSWNFNAQFYRGAQNADGSSNDSIIVVIYGNGNTALPAGTHTLAYFQYDAVNIDQPDTQYTSFELDKLVASDSVGNSLPIVVDAPQVVKVMNRTTFADVNDDGYVDILDLLMIVDHILQRQLLTGAAFERADVVFPFPGGDGVVNALDLAAVQNVILTGHYPDGTTINKISTPVAPVADAVQSLQKTSAAARVTFHITASGFAVRVESSRRVKGAQFELSSFSSIASSAQMKSVMGEGVYDVTSDSKLRVLVYDPAGASMDSGQYILANMDFPIANSAAVKVDQMILADEKNNAIEDVEIVISNDVAEELPVVFSLKQNFPNPFNPSTDIQFSVPTDGLVKLSIYNMLGQEVRTLFAGDVARGTRVVRWDGQNNAGVQMPSGTYIYRMVAGSFVESRKMMLLK